jgi:hypothetical protein
LHVICLAVAFLQTIFERISARSQFLDATSLESAGIVKNVSVMIGEYKFILDAVLATLAQVSGKAERKYE